MSGCCAEESAGRLKAIHIHYLTSSATITSSSRHFQVVLSPSRLLRSGWPGQRQPAELFISVTPPTTAEYNHQIYLLNGPEQLWSNNITNKLFFFSLSVIIFSTGTIFSRPGNRIGEQMELFTLHYLHMRGLNLKRHSPSRTRKSPSDKHGLAIDPSSHLWKWLIRWFKMKTFRLIPFCLEGKD